MLTPGSGRKKKKPRKDQTASKKPDRNSNISLAFVEAMVQKQIPVFWGRRNEHQRHPSGIN